MNRWDPKFEFSQEVSSFRYSNTIKTVYFIEITRITDATGKSKRNLNKHGKLSMRLLKTLNTRSTSDQNLTIIYLDSSPKISTWCSSAASSSSLVSLSISLSLFLRYNVFTVRYTGSGRPVSRAGAHDKSDWLKICNKGRVLLGSTVLTQTGLGYSGWRFPIGYFSNHFRLKCGHSWE